MIRLTDTQKVQMSIAAISAAGNPAPIEDVAVTSSDETVIIVSQSQSGYILSSTGKVGTSQIVVTADAKIGEGIETLTGQETIEVIAGQAIQLELTFGEPTSRV
jgi:hypothetical protein